MGRARAGEPSGLWVVADEQTQGRGRQGRPWSSPRGNLHASVLLRSPCAQRFAPQLGFVAGVSLLQALRVCAPAAPVSLKWPNDVLCGAGGPAGKLAGVLVEGATLPGGDFACVIGFGVNCSKAPDNLPYRAVSLADFGAQCAPADLIAALSDALAHNLELWRAGEGFPLIRSAWLAGARGLGAPMEARTHAGVTRGVFETIDEHGRLVLSTPSGPIKIEAGDVFPILESDASAAGDRTRHDA
ncbi:MAG: biotin--[acetyl-CoA-carboxylase] ligase [Beijerinckiaceae bacterium]|nr:biotin--[acetyl-CoA-carboxylase] ligase [Beijerinckiaceae bacterium]